MMANRPGPKAQNVLADQTILLTGSLTDFPYPLRRLVVWAEKNQKQVVFLTNHHKLTVSIVTDIYKDRWDIELFFKARKQNLKVKTFVSTSSNDLGSQIWAALIALLLLKGLHHLYSGRMVTVQPGRHAASKSLHIEEVVRPALTPPSHSAPHTRTGPVTARQA
ncbi:transposase [Desulfarculales bacterium]